MRAPVFVLVFVTAMVLLYLAAEAFVMVGQCLTAPAPPSPRQMETTMLDLDREADEPRAAYAEFKAALYSADQAIGDLIVAAHKAGLDEDIQTVVNEFCELWGEHNA